MRPDGVVVPAPGLDQDLRLLQAVEDLPIQQLVPELTSLTPSALTTSATFLPWPSRTSASRSLAMISSARKPLRGIDLPPNALQALTSAWTDSPGEGQCRRDTRALLRGRGSSCFVRSGPPAPGAGLRCRQAG